MAETTTQQPLTALEQKVLQDYGKYTYKAVPLPTVQQYQQQQSRPASNPYGAIASFGGWARKTPAQLEKEYNDYLSQLGSVLPEGVELVGNELRITPNSSLYDTKKSNMDIYGLIRNQAAEKARLDAYNARLRAAGKEPVSALPVGMGIINPLFRGLPGITAFGGVPNPSTSQGGFWNMSGGMSPYAQNRERQQYKGPLSLLGGYPDANSFTGIASLIGNQNRFRDPFANAKTGEATRTYDEALQQYLRKSGGATNAMTLDQLKAQIESNRQAMMQNQNLAASGNVDSSDADALLAKYYAPPMPAPLTPEPMQLAKGGSVNAKLTPEERNTLSPEERRTLRAERIAQAGGPRSTNIPPIAIGRMPPSALPPMAGGTVQMYGNPNLIPSLPQTAPAPREMTLAQYEAKRARNNPGVGTPQIPMMGTTPMSEEELRELLARYYGQPQNYAEGGQVKGYAQGTTGEPTYDDLVEQYIPQEAAPTMEVSATAPTVAPAMLGANPELAAMLQQYTAGGTDYTAELKQAREDRKASEKAFGETLDKLMTSADSGPSKAEMYYRLAAAFGTPTPTGHFAEGLGLANKAMAEHTKEERGSKSAKRKLEAEVALKKQELALEGAKDTEKTLLGLQNETNKDKREYIKAMVKEYIDSGKPQSEAGKIAKDMGFKVGTEDYQKEVDKQAKLLVEKQMAAINSQLLSGQATLAGLQISQSKEQREALKLEPDERKAIRDDEDAMYAAKNTMKNIDEAMAAAELAFGNTPGDRATYRKLKITNPTDPRVVATEQLENLLGTNVIGSLRASFGGNPTEGERNALRDLQGLSAASAASRKKILERAKKSLSEGIEYRSMRINKIETGGYRKKPQETKE